MIDPWSEGGGFTRNVTVSMNCLEPFQLNDPLLKCFKMCPLEAKVVEDFDPFGIDFGPLKG